MADLLWLDTPYGFGVFLGLTIALGGAGAFATGRALASTWRPLALLLPYMIGLAAAIQFLHFALFQEPLLSLHYYLIGLVWTMIAAVAGYQMMRATQMATQYSWLYEKAGPTWRLRPTP